MVSKDEWVGMLKRFKNRRLISGKKTIVSFVEKLKSRMQIPKRHK